MNIAITFVFHSLSCTRVAEELRQPSDSGVDLAHRSNIQLCVILRCTSQIYHITLSLRQPLLDRLAKDTIGIPFGCYDLGI